LTEAETLMFSLLDTYASKYARSAYLARKTMRARDKS